MNRKFLLLLTVICLALLVGCTADRIAAQSTVNKFWKGWNNLEKVTIMETLTNEVEYKRGAFPSTLGAGAIADKFTDANVYWEGCTDKKFVINETTEYPQSKLIIVETQVSWMKNSNPVKYNINFTLSKTNSGWRISKIIYV